MQPLADGSERVYAPVSRGRPVLLHRNACVELRSRHAECGHCEKICPAAALRVHGQEMTVEPNCSGCGRCVAACPTGALRVGGFESARAVTADKRGPLTVDCQRSPRGAEIRVPCLGGLSLGALIDMRLAARDREIELIDHGWCAACPAGRGSTEHPVAKSLARALARMRDAGVPEPLLPRLEEARLPESEASSPPSSGRFYRRAALTRFSGAPVPHSAGRFVPAAAPERERILAGLSRLAARYGGQVSPKLFHAVELDAEACQAHGVCAAGCPSGALRLQSERGNTTVLSHLSVLCIGCGHCERVCPEKAVKLAFGGGRAGGRQALAQFARAECSACGAEFSRAAATATDQMVCERCAKSRALAQSAFQQVYGSKAPGL